MNFCLDYDFEFGYIAQEIRRIKPKKILIQLPNGFQRCYSYIVQNLRGYIGRDIEILLSLNPSYGPCLVDEYAAKEAKADIIIHFGHVEYPLYRPNTRTLFIPVEYKGVDIDRVKALLDNVCNNKSIVCLASSSQHTRLCKKVEVGSTKCRIVYKGVVFGCTPVNVDKCDVLVVVAGGRFSCISQFLALHSKYEQLPIYCLDPYSYTLWSPREEFVKLLKIRMWKLHKALEGRRWLIVSGFYGQSRTEVVNALAKKLRESGFDVSISKVLRLSRDVVENLGSSFDVIVVASCPYLAFDLYDLEIPVLTVGEALMVLSKTMDRYIYPW